MFTEALCIIKMEEYKLTIKKKTKLTINLNKWCKKLGLVIKM